MRLIPMFETLFDPSFSVLGSGGWRGLARAYFSSAAYNPYRALVSFSSGLRYRTHDDVRVAAGELPYRSEVGCARHSRNGRHGPANLRSSDAFSGIKYFWT
jgi:hypothetical protein